MLTLLLFSRLSIICIFCSKASNPNNSKGYEVRYTYFAPIFDAGSNQNQMQPDMDHGPFLGNPKADRSEAEGFWGGSLSLLSCCSMRVFLFKTVDRGDDFIPSKPLFFKESLFKAISMRYPETRSLVCNPSWARSGPIFPDINNGFISGSPRPRFEGLR